MCRHRVDHNAMLDSHAEMRGQVRNIWDALRRERRRIWWSIRKHGSWQSAPVECR